MLIRNRLPTSDVPSSSTEGKTVALTQCRLPKTISKPVVIVSGLNSSSDRLVWQRFSSRYLDDPIGAFAINGWVSRWNKESISAWVFVFRAASCSSSRQFKRLSLAAFKDEGSRHMP